ncbi:hypothetical protein HHI36_023747 [Cryptolaemus montrouzieri]|uniref:Uncharacterized protein n=1 Tax=Cryptolaemus montrouzieri TaxID=559131 RepID=A0ABD2PIA4_9CUCU
MEEIVRGEKEEAAHADEMRTDPPIHADPNEHLRELQEVDLDPVRRHLLEVSIRLEEVQDIMLARKIVLGEPDNLDELSKCVAKICKDHGRPRSSAAAAPVDVRDDEVLSRRKKRVREFRRVQESFKKNKRALAAELIDQQPTIAPNEMPRLDSIRMAYREIMGTPSLPDNHRVDPVGEPSITGGQFQSPRCF